MKIVPVIILIGFMVFGFMMLTGGTEYISPSPIEPIPDKEVHKCGYTGEVTGTVRYDVMILDGLDEQEIYNSLLYVPSVIEFNIVEPDATQYVIETKGEFTGAHFPMHDNLMIFIDGDKYPELKAAGLAWFNDDITHRVCICVYDKDSNASVGIRAWHEILHSIAKDGDADCMDSDLGYKVFKDRKLFKQYEYYGYLMVKYQGDLYG